MHYIAGGKGESEMQKWMEDYQKYLEEYNK